MYCPEDGTHLPYQVDRDCGGTVHYGPCEVCKVTWVYDGEQGVYLPCQRQATPESIDVTVAHILDMLERQAREEGKAEYLFGLVSKGLVVEYEQHVPEVRSYGTLRHISYFGDERRVVSRTEAIRLLLGARTSQEGEL